MFRPINILILCLAFPSLCLRAEAMGEEHFGFSDLGSANYKDYPGLAEVVNHPSRVYQFWVNGGEKCYYDADLEELKELLDRFSRIEAGVHPVVLRPGTPVATSFRMHDEKGKVVEEPRSIPYNCEIRIVQGIMAAVAGSHAPVLTIFIDERKLSLKDLEFPAGIVVQGPSEVRAELLAELKSKNSHARGSAASDLAATEPYTADNVPAISGLLADEDQWVRSEAAWVLGRLGKHAAAALPALVELRKKEPTNESVARAIQLIETAGDPISLTDGEQRILSEIEHWVSARP